MIEVAAAGEHVICLRMRFAAYEALLTELGDDAGARSPSADHERYNRLLDGRRRTVGGRHNALHHGAYEEIAHSEQLRSLPIAELDRFLELRTAKGQSEIVRLWQAWLCDHRPASD